MLLGVIDQSIVADELPVWSEVVDVCLNGVFRVTRAAVPHMTQAAYGRIVSIASRATSGTLHGTNYFARRRR